MPVGSSPKQRDVPIPGLTPSAPDAWEILYFAATNAPNGGPEEDWDGDGACNSDEWRAGTDPTDTTSLFRVVSIDMPSDPVFEWSSETGKVYSLWGCTNLVSGEFTLAESAIPATPPLNTCTVQVTGAACLIYRITVNDD